MRRRTAKDYFTYFTPAIILALAGFILAYQFVDPAPPRHITIATGRSTGAYYEIARKYSRILARDGVTLTVRETSGSVENLKLLTDKNSGVDVIFLQGGVATTTPSEDLVSLGSIYYEPLWVFHREEQPIRLLTDLKGKRIAAGIEGSGTRELALQLLDLNDVSAENSRILHINDDEAVAKLLTGEIDAAFFVVAYRGHAGRKLLFDPDIRLMNFQRGEAYTRRLHFLSLVKLPEGVVDFSSNIPAEDVYLLAPTAQLVVRKDFHPALTDLLLLAAGEAGSPAGVFEKQGDFPTPQYIDYPLSGAAEQFHKSGPPFLRRYLPFWLANLLIRMKIMLLPLLALLFPLFKLLPPFYKWRVRSRIFRWYDRLMEIDSEMLHGGIADRKDEFLSRLSAIEQQVSQISVPRGYSRELYDMRIHIQMLREKLVAAGADTCPTAPVSPIGDKRLSTRMGAGPNSSLEAAA
jgi:TRAP transporter TAXI family solute receptor